MANKSPPIPFPVGSTKPSIALAAIASYLGSAAYKAGEGFEKVLYAWIPAGMLNLADGSFQNFSVEMGFRLDPLSCVMLGFEGQADEEVLGALAGIFLNASRDTDILGRFDQSSFLFFLPRTGPDGAEVMASRIRESAEEQGLRDLVGDLLQIAVGISYCPHPDVVKREDLFSRARSAFLAAQREGGVVVSCE